jgi:predicted amidohydrolase YtcJ
MTGFPASVAIAALCIAWSTCGLAEAPADRVFLNGTVYTVNEAQPWATAVVIRGSRIAYVGGVEGARQYIGDMTEVVDLDGRMLMPGFHDSHMHPMAAGTRFLRCRLHGLTWPDEVLHKITECARDRSPTGWFRGVGLDDSVF